MTIVTGHGNCEPDHDQKLTESEISPDYATEGS